MKNYIKLLRSVFPKFKFRTKLNSNPYKNPYGNEVYENRILALLKKLATYSKASILFSFLISEINLGKDEIIVVVKDLFKDAKTKKINGSIYLDRRFPNYFLDLTNLDKDFKVSDLEIKEVSKDGNSGGIVKEALLSFKFVRILEEEKVS